MVIAEMMTPKQICERLAAWAEVAGIHGRIESTGVESESVGALVVAKSDLLLRMIYAGEMPSQTKCPVHKGVWSGMHLGWPGTFAAAYAEKDAVVAEVDPMLLVWYDEGCRCFQHRGSQATTGWQPDEACGCVVRAEGETLGEAIVGQLGMNHPVEIVAVVTDKGWFYKSKKKDEEE